MTGDNGSEAPSERLAPVIPLFGARGASNDGGRSRASAARTTPPADPSPPSAEAEWHSTWAEESAAARRGPGPRHPAAAALPSDERRMPAGSSPEHGSDAGEGRGDRSSSVRLRALGRHSAPEPADADLLGDAREALVRKLRTKQLTCREARDVLRELGVPAEDRDAVIDEFEQRGYLDDTALAEHLVTSGAQRKGQGRVAISRTLAQRGIPAEIADEALSALEDDDAERALDYARSKISGLRRYDEDTAIRRLVGQLSRRGYGGGVAMNAARTAWRETQFGAGRGKVRFEKSD
ncbi:regulatory protein RecX [Microbacterium capsulatum]|uniref:Regulatory protein RecX n=1 Tax=Microbacterium capsulatum TaxID=3041921 RepID=A0ABU0XBW4_9MICO|nr:regulatory protein RecX [Microbacterium sp. ASV81]MDQ4212452.1 regulatory protein RecX [Microbacterium sp. ASV81]